jgi:hypothetical protein
MRLGGPLIIIFPLAKRKIPTYLSATELWPSNSLPIVSFLPELSLLSTFTVPWRILKCFSFFCDWNNTAHILHFPAVSMCKPLNPFPQHCRLVSAGSISSRRLRTCSCDASKVTISGLTSLEPYALFRHVSESWWQFQRFRAVKSQSPNSVQAISRISSWIRLKNRFECVCN